MPIYNAEKTLAAAIDSILSQTFKKFNLILVDDASTDGSLEIAKKYLSDSRVHLYRNKINMGAYYCRNFGLYIGKDFNWTHFTTHDADDISFKDRYKSIMQSMSQNKKINAIQDTFERIDGKTGRTISSKVTLAHAVFTRGVFDALGYFDNVRFGGDWEHWARLKLLNANASFGVTKSIHTVNGESYIYENNLTVLIPENSTKRLKYIDRATRKIEKLFRQNKIKYDFYPEPGVTKAVSQ